MEMGGFNVSDVVAAIVKTDLLELGSRRKIDGVFGLEVFRRGLLTVDYPGQRLVVSDAALGPVDGISVFRVRLQRGVPEVKLSWRTGGEWVVLDSGNEGGITLSKWPEGIEVLAGPVDARMYMDAAGAMHWMPTARLRGKFGLGGVTLVDPIVDVEDGVAAIGTEVLENLRVTIDVANDRVRLECDKGVLKFGAIAGVGAALGPLADRRDAWTVHDVLPGSPAARAGVQKGDLVVLVNERAIELWREEDLWGVFKSAGTTVSIRVIRGNEELSLEVPVIDLVP